MSFPKITAAQIVALIFAGLPSVLVLFGVDLTPDQKDALDNLQGLGLGLFGADALIRVGRNVGTGLGLPKGVSVADGVQNEIHMDDPEGESHADELERKGNVDVDPDSGEPRVPRGLSG